MNLQLRCRSCRRLLFEMSKNAIAGEVSIKCPRCGAFNILRPSSPSQERSKRHGRQAKCGCSSPQKT
ncbi:Com family DNA-binding transcriptional regulator [Pseudaestuariivita sp.]|uniref:Com family DNA-binding transcriptional regulator n=1 Tax=Pseudaestuariivita sp. TaxID=2211669 RepID=UPI00405820ED